MHEHNTGANLDGVDEKVLRCDVRGYVEFEESGADIWINYLHVYGPFRRKGVAEAMLEHLYKKGKLMHRSYFLTSGECLRHVHDRLSEKYPLTRTRDLRYSSRQSTG